MPLYIYIYVCVCVCVCAYARVSVCVYIYENYKSYKFIRGSFEKFLGSLEKKRIDWYFCFGNVLTLLKKLISFLMFSGYITSAGVLQQQNWSAIALLPGWGSEIFEQRSYTHTHTHKYICVCMCVCVWVYIYIYICIYTYI